MASHSKHLTPIWPYVHKIGPPILVLLISPKQLETASSQYKMASDILFLLQNPDFKIITSLPRHSAEKLPVILLIGHALQEV